MRPRSAKNSLPSACKWRPRTRITTRNGPASSISSSTAPRLLSAAPASVSILKPVKGVGHAWSKSESPARTTSCTGRKPARGTRKRSGPVSTSRPSASSVTRTGCGGAGRSPGLDATRKSSVLARLPGRSGWRWSSSHLTLPSGQWARARCWDGIASPSSSMTKWVGVGQFALAKGYADSHRFRDAIILG